MKRRYLVPEVLEASDGEGGVACLKAVLAGYDAAVPYSELLQACESERDTPAFDRLGVVAAGYGLGVRKIQRPPDLMLSALSVCLPAIVTIELADRGARVVVLWRVHGPWVQVMDPTSGRLWIPRTEMVASLQIQEDYGPAAVWEEWSNSAEFTASIKARMRALSVPAAPWSDPAHQDAALRLAGALMSAGKLKKGRESRELLDLCAAHPEEIPRQYWSRCPGARAVGTVVLRGTTLLAISRMRRGADEGNPPKRRAAQSSAGISAESAASVWQPLLQALRTGDRLLPGAIVSALCAAAFGTVLEALLFRGWLDIGRHLESTAGRLGALAALMTFLVILLALDWPAALGMYRIGRRLELRLRSALLTRIPRTADGYFQNRRIADLAFRAHWLYSPRQLPEALGYSLYLIANILVTGAAIAWIYPGSGVLVGLAMFASCAMPLLFLPRMEERDLRYRELSAALGSVHLDSLMGSRAIQAHGAQDSMRAAHARLLREWAAAGLRLQVLFVKSDALQMTLSFACVVGLVYRQSAVASGPAGVLLLIYWAISIPLLGREVATTVRSIPAMRTTLLRFRELMGSGDGAAARAVPVTAPDGVARPTGVRIEFNDVCVEVAGHRILNDVTVSVAAGEHVGIVGTSGAGKSSLVGCLLGWHQPVSGSLRVDDAALNPSGLVRLRSETAWIDPQIHLFRTSLLENLAYGNDVARAAPAGDVVESAELGAMLERLPAGLQTPLGEGGTLISGGEGQRVRIGRALGRSHVRLAILDEPGRGLAHEERRRVITTSRRRFSGATLLCVTHDVSDTLDFDRVLVLDRGRVVEQGSPQILSELSTSRYRQLLDEERAVRRSLWVDAAWRRLTLKGGTLHEVMPGGDCRGFGEVRAIHDARPKQP